MTATVNKRNKRSLKSYRFCVVKFLDLIAETSGIGSLGTKIQISHGITFTTSTIRVINGERIRDPFTLI